MLQIKTRFLLGALLLAGLGSCQREKPVRAAPAEPAAPAPALNDSLPQTPATGQTINRTWHRLAQRTRRNAPLVYRRGTTRPFAADTAAPPPSEARLHDLTLKASEYFQIDPTQPAEVHGREGTIVRLPAQVLVNASEKPATGPVWVELKECYTVADMLLSNLSTVTPEGDLLDSGGIVLVRASAHGQPLHVAAGQAFQLEMPFVRRQKGMRLFYGQGSRRQQPAHWVAAGPIVRHPAPPAVATQATQMPSYGSGPADINRLIRYPAAALASRTEGLVYVSFVVDEGGKVLSPNVVRSLGDGCDEEVLRVLALTSGHWTPARQGGQLVPVKMTLPIRFSLQQQGQMTAENSPDPAANADTLPATDEGDDHPEVSEPAAAHYAFQADRLGWLTCEREWRPAGAQAAFTATADTEPTTSVHLVFRESTTIVAGEPRAEGYHFAGVPANQRAVVVGVQYRNGTPYLAMQETVTGQRETETLEFRETTLAELERELEKLQ
ncbi:energy transducer TonB [Hymenobacter daecheongensis]|nr:energy transducer TonB [Hymenobacter daecheongensis]